MAETDNIGGPAAGKRSRIADSQKQVVGIVLVTSLVVGICAVLALHFVQYIIFNKEVITAKDESIATYEQVIKNVGVCKDANGDGKFSEKELKNCEPNNIAVDELPADTLRYNVMTTMANNKDLETIARNSQSDCFSDGKKIDYRKMYDEATNEDQKAYYLDLAKMCSALRVIPDAMPAKRNDEALMASLNQIFIISGWEPEGLSPSGENTDEEDENDIPSSPVSLSLETSSSMTQKVLSNIERSIRTFDIRSASISWMNGNVLSLQAQAKAYYLGESGIKEGTKTIYADKEKEKEMTEE